MDDVLIVGCNKSKTDVFVHELCHNFKITMGTYSKFLGMQIEQCQDGISVCQCVYTEKAPEGLKMREANLVATPCDRSNGGTEDSVGSNVP